MKLIAALLVAVVVLAMLSLTAGRVWVPWEAWTSAAADPRWAIIFELRLPRTLLAMLIGAGLAVSGAALQGYTRNPLADPGVLGVSSLAALGAVLSLYVGLVVQIPWLGHAAAMAGALGGVVLLLGLAGQMSSVVTFLLAGVILNTIGAAGVALALSLAPNPWAVNEIVNWLMGSLSDRSAGDLGFAAPFIAAGVGLLFLTGRALDALTLGETGARSLGVDLGRTRWLLAIGVGLATGAGVAVTGVVGFVGLVVPHLVRPLVGARPGALLAPSALAGAVLVLLADMLVRIVPSEVEVKLGVAMSAVGGPFFLALLIRLRRRMA